MAPIDLGLQTILLNSFIIGILYNFMLTMDTTRFSDNWALFECPFCAQVFSCLCY